VLLQYWGDGNGLGEVERRELQGEDREVDGAAKKDKDIRVGFTAAVFASVRRGCGGNGSSVEPTWAWRGQRERDLQAIASRSSQFVALEWEREALGET